MGSIRAGDKRRIEWKEGWKGARHASGSSALVSIEKLEEEVTRRAERLLPRRARPTAEKGKKQRGGEKKRKRRRNKLGCLEQLGKTRNQTRWGPKRHGGVKEGIQNKEHKERKQAPRSWRKKTPRRC